MSAIAIPTARTALFDYPKYWAECFGTAPFLPVSQEEMDRLGWDSCDIIIVTGDAYVDHPSFGMAVIGRLLEAQGFRVGIIAQPDWQSKDAFQALGKPNLPSGSALGFVADVVETTRDGAPASAACAANTSSRPRVASRKRLRTNEPSPNRVTTSSRTCPMSSEHLSRESTDLRLRSRTVRHWSTRTENWRRTSPGTPPN